MRSAAISLAVGAVLAFAFLAAAVPARADSFTFDADDEGWEQIYVGRPAGATYDTLFGSGMAGWTAAEGNSPGSIFQTVGTATTTRAYWMGKIGPDNLLGDLTGQSLQTDIWSTSNWVTIADGAGGDDGHVYARWVIANEIGTSDTWNMYVSKRSASIDLNDVTGWETHAIALDEANFLRWPNSDANTQDFADLLSDYDQIGLYVFSGTDTMANIDGGTGTWGAGHVLNHYGAHATDGFATWGLDNFAAVPEPASILLLGGGVLVLGLRTRRRRNA